MSAKFKITVVWVTGNNHAGEVARTVVASTIEEVAAELRSIYDVNRAGAGPWPEVTVGVFDDG